MILTPTTPKVLVRTNHGHFYNMGGFCEGVWFQKCMQHGVVPSSKPCGARVSLTYRLTSRTAARTGFRPVITKPLTVQTRERFMGHLSFDSVFGEVEQYLQPDTSFSFGKWHTNHGRLAGEFMDGRYWSNPKEFHYTYSKKTLHGNLMGPIVRELCEAVGSVTGQTMDWAHVNYYPLKETKLGTHSDSEPEIAYGSDIACVTFMQHADDYREIFVVGNDALRAATAATRMTKAAPS